MPEEIKKLVTPKKEDSKFYEELSKKSFDYPEPTTMQERPIGAQPVDTSQQQSSAKVKKSQ